MRGKGRGEQKKKSERGWVGETVVEKRKVDYIWGEIKIKSQIASGVKGETWHGAY